MKPRVFALQSTLLPIAAGTVWLCIYLHMTMVHSTPNPPSPSCGHPPEKTVRSSSSPVCTACSPGSSTLGGAACAAPNSGVPDAGVAPNREVPPAAGAAAAPAASPPAAALLAPPKLKAGAAAVLKLKMLAADEAAGAAPKENAPPLLLAACGWWGG